MLNAALTAEKLLTPEIQATYMREGRLNQLIWLGRKVPYNLTGPSIQSSGVLGDEVGERQHVEPFKLRA